MDKTNDRYFEIEYKGTTIHGYKGSNWVYINDRPFESLHKAKIWITRKIKYQEKLLQNKLG